MESLSELYEGCRSYRRFEQKAVPKEILREIVVTAGRRSSGMNAQTIRYVAVSSPEKVDEIQPCLRWAAKLPKEIGTPKEDEQPTAFVILLGPEKQNTISSIDAGIALDTMAITAWQHGVGSCIIASVDRQKLAGIIEIPEGFTVLTVLALGYPSHKSTVVRPDEEHGLNYYVDGDRNYYVPKRPEKEIIQYV